LKKSTLPVKTAQTMENILNANDRSIRFEVISNPEFLAEGTAVKDLLEPWYASVNDFRDPFLVSLAGPVTFI
jgi:UDPglucose 6-dehydrogenase